MFSCFGYQSDAKHRLDYFKKLNTAFKVYVDDGNLQNLLTIFNECEIAKFKPRAKEGTPEYKKSMHCLLSELKENLNLLDAQWKRIQVKPLERIESPSAMIAAGA